MYKIVVAIWLVASFCGWEHEPVSKVMVLSTFCHHTVSMRQQLSHQRRKGTFVTNGLVLV